MIVVVAVALVSGRSGGIVVVVELSVGLCSRETFDSDCSHVIQGQAPVQAILRSRFEPFIC